MKLGLYSITYLGIWYRGEPLSLKELLRRAARQGWEGVELDTKRPHAAPMDLSGRDRAELRDLAGELGLGLCAVSPNCDLSSHIPEHREAMICYVRACIELARDLGAPLCKVFAAWPGVVVRDGLAEYRWTRALPDPFPQWAGERMDIVLSSLRELARFAEDQGVTLALQNHGPVIRSHRDVHDLVERVGSPALRPCVDLPAELDVNADPAGARALGRRVGAHNAHSHVFGEFRRGPDGQAELFFEPRFAYPAYLEGLAEAGYTGFVSWELCRPAIRRDPAQGPARWVPGSAAPVEGERGGIDLVDEQTELALEYLRRLRAAAQARAKGG